MNIFSMDVESGQVDLNLAAKRGLRASLVCVSVLCALWCASLALFGEIEYATQQDRCCSEALRNVYDFIGNTNDDIFYIRDKPCLCQDPLDPRIAAKFYHKLQLSHALSRCVVALEFGISYCVGSFAVSDTDFRIAINPVLNSVGSSFYDVTEEYVTFDGSKATRVSVNTRRPNSATISYVAGNGRRVQEQVFGLECQCLLFLQESCVNTTHKIT